MNHQQPPYQRLLLALLLALALLLFALTMPGLPVWAAHQPGGIPSVVRLEPTNTPTNTPAPTNTPRPTATNTPRPTPTDTPIPTATDTPVPAATATDTASPTTTPGTATVTTTATPGPASTPDLTATPPASPTSLAGPVSNSGGGSVFGTLFQLPFPGCLSLLGSLLVLGLLAFLLRRRQIAARSQPSASPALASSPEENQPTPSAEPIPQPAAPSVASAPEPTPASDADTLFALAALRLAPTPAADGSTSAAPVSAAPATSPPEILLPAMAETDQREEAPPAVPLEQPASEEQPAAEAVPGTAAPAFPYQLGDLLSQDTTGMLYYAQASQSQQPKAIKLLSPRFFSRPRARKLFLQQAQNLTLLEDPHLVPVEEFGIKGSRGYLVMPYLSGGSLGDRLTEPLPLPAIWRYLKPLAKTLDYLHECQVAHLHLNPENILFDETDQLRVSGAGLVTLLIRLAQENGTSFSVTPSAFVAPEQQAGEPDWRSDLYTLGVLLYAMLTSQDEVFAQGNQPPEASLLRTLRPDLPLALEDVLAQAVAENPEARYQSAEELALAFYAAVRPGS